MKKSIAILIVIAISCALFTACDVKTPDGQVVNSSDYQTHEFIITEHDLATDRGSTVAYIRMENEAYDVLIRCYVDLYMKYDLGDTIVCQFRPQNDGQGFYTGDMKLDGEALNVLCVIVK